MQGKCEKGAQCLDLHGTNKTGKGNPTERRRANHAEVDQEHEQDDEQYQEYDEEQQQQEQEESQEQAAYDTSDSSLSDLNEEALTIFNAMKSLPKHHQKKLRKKLTKIGNAKQKVFR